MVSAQLKIWTILAIVIYHWTKRCEGGGGGGFTNCMMFKNRKLLKLVLVIGIGSVSYRSKKVTSTKVQKILLPEHVPQMGINQQFMVRKWDA